MLTPTSMPGIVMLPANTSTVYVEVGVVPDFSLAPCPSGIAPSRCVGGRVHLNLKYGSGVDQVWIRCVRGGEYHLKYGYHGSCTASRSIALSPFPHSLLCIHSHPSGVIRGCGAVAYDRNAGNNVTADLTSLITVTTLPSTDGGGSTCDLGQLMLSLCNPGTYVYTYTVTNSNGAPASATRTLIVYNVSYFTLPGIIVFPAMTSGPAATLTAATLNGNNATATSNYTAATKGVAKRLASLGVLDSDVDVFDAAVATVRISNTISVYNVSITAKVWWFFPSTVHRSMLRTYQSALSSAKQQRRASAPIKKSRLSAFRLKASAGRRRRRLDSSPDSSVESFSSAIVLDEAVQSLPAAMQAAHEVSFPLGFSAGTQDAAVAGWSGPRQRRLSGHPAARAATRSAARSNVRSAQLEVAEARGTSAGRILASERPSQRSQVPPGPAAPGHARMPPGPGAPGQVLVSPSPAAHGQGRRRLLDVASSMMAAANSVSVSSTTTSVAPDAAANTMASITGLMKILLNGTSAGSSALNKVASGIGNSIQQAMNMESLRGNKVGRTTMWVRY